MEKKKKKNRKKKKKKIKKKKKKSHKNKRKSRKPTKNSRKTKKASRKPKKASRKPKKASRKPKKASRKPKKVNRKPKKTSRKPKKTSRKPKKTSHKPKKKRIYRMKGKASPDEESRKSKLEETMDTLTKLVVAGSDKKPGVLVPYLNRIDVGSAGLANKHLRKWFEKNNKKNKRLSKIIKEQKKQAAAREEAAAREKAALKPPRLIFGFQKFYKEDFPPKVQEKWPSEDEKIPVDGQRIRRGVYLIELPFEPYKKVLLKENLDYNNPNPYTMIDESYYNW